MDNREIIYSRIRQDASMKDADSLCALYSKDIEIGSELVDFSIENSCIQALRFFDNTIHIRVLHNTFGFNFQLHGGLIYDERNNELSIDTAKTTINDGDIMNKLTYPTYMHNMKETFFRMVPYLYGSSCHFALTTVGWVHKDLECHLRLYNGVKYPEVIWDSDNGDYSVLESMCRNIDETMYRHEMGKLDSCIEDF